MTVRGPGVGTTRAHAPGPRTDAARRPGAGAVVAAGLVAVGTCLTALAVTGGLPQAVPEGLPDAGALTGWGLRIVSLLAVVAAVGTVGSLVVAAVLLPARTDGTLGGTARRAASAAGRWAAGWAVLTAGELVLTASDVAGVPVTRIGGGAVAEVASTRPGAALCLTAALATVIGVWAGASRTSAGARVLLVVSVAGLLPGAVAGHASSAPGHDVVVSALVVHVVAVSLWTGGLLGLVLHVRTEPTLLPGAVARFSPLALGAYLALTGSGLIAVAERLGASGAAWTSGYGALVAAKATALLVLGLLGHLHRRTTIASLAREGNGRPFLRLAGVELLLMGVAIGLASALSRTAVPVPAEVRPDHGTGHPTLPAVVEPLSVAELATAWRPDAIVLVVLAAAASAYAGGVRDLRRRGHSWPRARTVAFAAGIGVALVVLCSGVATYAPAVLSVQVAQLLAALLLVPLLVLLGDPAGLAVEVGTARGTEAPARLLRSGVARAAASAVPGAVAVCVLLLAVYRTPLIEMSQRSSWMHLAVLTLAMAAGLLLLWPVLGAEVSPRPGGAAEWQWSMVGVAGCLAILAAQLRYGDRLLAAEWFLELRWSWIDPVADQRLAGALVAAATVAVLVLVVLLGARGRTDHGTDRGTDRSTA